MAYDGGARKHSLALSAGQSRFWYEYIGAAFNCDMAVKLL